MNGATYVSNSSNAKIAGSQNVDTTYTSIQASCSSSCPLKNKFCYAQSGFVAYTNGRLDREAVGKTALQVARAEVQAINNAYNGGKIPEGRNLRLHTSGDCRSLSSVRIVNKAVGKWKERGGNKAWSYTHAWDIVKRSEWSNVSVLASIESVSQVDCVRKQGYAPSLVVAEHLSNKPYKIKGSDVMWIPCAAQTKGIGCVDCRICFDADKLFKSNCGVAFAAHGIVKNTLKRYLNVIK